MSKHRGSNFDDFIEEEGLLEQAEAETAKRIFIFLLEKEIKKKSLIRVVNTTQSGIKSFFAHGFCAIHGGSFSRKIAFYDIKV